MFLQLNVAAERGKRPPNQPSLNFDLPPVPTNDDTGTELMDIDGEEGAKPLPCIWNFRLKDGHFLSHLRPIQPVARWLRSLKDDYNRIKSISFFGGVLKIHFTSNLCMKQYASFLARFKDILNTRTQTIHLRSLFPAFRRV
ncbi:hypothetical protein ACOME3_007237 [Neoechinorhynchus agilis]